MVLSKYNWIYPSKLRAPYLLLCKTLNITGFICWNWELHTIWYISKALNMPGFMCLNWELHTIWYMKPNKLNTWYKTLRESAWKFENNRHRKPKWKLYLNHQFRATLDDLLDRGTFQLIWTLTPVCPSRSLLCQGTWSWPCKGINLLAFICSYAERHGAVNLYA